MIIDCLSSEEKKLLKKVPFKKGEILFYENDICTSIGIVIEGEIKISSITYEGNEIIYNLLKSGSLFGNNLLFSKNNKYKGDVKASKDGSLYLIDKNSLMKILKSNEEFLLEYLSIHSEFAKELNSKIKLLTFTNAKERFLYYLFINDNHIVFSNVTSLAHELYLSREATSRLISTLIKEKIISRNKNEITLIDSSFYF